MKKKPKLYGIVDIVAFIESTRILVYETFGKSDSDILQTHMSYESLNDQEKEEIDYCLPIKDCELIIQDYIVKSSDDKIFISDKKYIEFIQELNLRLVSNMLMKMSNQGILESAFDSEENDFVFWIKNNEETNTDKTD